MNTLPLPAIIERLCELSGCQANVARSFFSEFSALVSQTLEEQGTLQVRGLGTFRTIEMGGVKTVEFAPDAALADAVNAPFAMFEPVELDDAVTSDMLAEADNVPEAAGHTEPVETSDDHAEPEGTASEVETAEAGNEQETTIPTADEEAEIVAVPPATPRAAARADAGSALRANSVRQSDEQPKPVEVPREKIIEKERVVEVVNHSNHLLHHVLTAIVALIAGVAIGYFAYDKLNLTGVKNVSISADDVQVYHQVTTPAAEATANVETTADSVPSTAAEPENKAVHPETSSVAADTADSTRSENKIVTDTVRSNRFLTTMAQQYYGKKKFWVYIYQENSDRLTDPDRIASNTVVVIPPAEKYGIKAGDAASEAAAEQLAAQILNRYPEK